LRKLFLPHSFEAARYNELFCIFIPLIKINFAAARANTPKPKLPRKKAA